MRRGSGRIIGGLVAALALVAVPTGASAEITVDPAFTILYVKGDDGPNQIAVECRDGLVTVNDSPAANGQASCADLEKLRVFGFGGDDTITLSGFAASLGGQSSDAFGGYGTQPEFSVSGGDGNDILRGDATEEIFNGGPGDDVLTAPGALAALMSGGRGNDRLFGKSLLVDFMAGGPGNDRIGGSTLFSVDLGGDGADTIVGGRHSDFEVGGKGQDKLVGKAGRDALLGVGGRDAIFGGADDDTLAGGRGRDRLRGGPGRDKEFQGGLPHRGRHHLPGFAQILGGSHQVVSVSSRLLKRLAR
ncbi:MAG TPA: calcium-binding protein [Solirubrobacterales bacterium]